MKYCYNFFGTQLYCFVLISPHVKKPWMRNPKIQIQNGKFGIGIWKIKIQTSKLEIWELGILNFNSKIDIGKSKFEIRNLKFEIQTRIRKSKFQIINSKFWNLIFFLSPFIFKKAANFLVPFLCFTDATSCTILINQFFQQNPTYKISRSPQRGDVELALMRRRAHPEHFKNRMVAHTASSYKFQEKFDKT